jgi:HlyD family secretion protein
MKTNKLFMIASGGILFGVISVFIYNKHLKPIDPLSVSFNPYEQGVYASGIVESFQRNGSNVNLYPSVSGRVTEILVIDGESVKKDQPLLQIDSTTQIATAEQSQSTADASKANFLSLQEQYNKLNKSYTLNPKSVSRNDLDNARYAAEVADQNARAAQSLADSDMATLLKYTIRAPVDGTILRVVPAIGDYVSITVGSYDIYTQGNLPVIQMGEASPYMQVRVFVDEILTPLLPTSEHFEATMFIRGMNNKAVPLSFVNIQPFTIPNIELNDQRSEKVDVRVLPIIFKFQKPADINLFPGQLVDVYIKAKA